MSGYRVVLQAFDEAGAAERRQAEQRYGRALEAELGGAELVVPVYRQYLRLLQIHGEAVDLETLDEAERAIMQGWQAAEAAALSAALGPHRYMGDAQFEIVLD
jgi:hypothetical protein